MEDSPLTPLFERGSSAAMVTLREIADALDVSYRTVQSYREGQRRPTPEACLTFAAYLRRRAAEIVKAADALERGARKEANRGKA